MDQAPVVEEFAGSLPLTSADNETGSGATEPNIPTGFGDDRRMIPLFDVRLPEGLVFTPRFNGLFPHSLLGNGYVFTKKEVDSKVHLSSHGKECSD